MPQRGLWQQCLEREIILHPHPPVIGLPVLGHLIKVKEGKICSQLIEVPIKEAVECQGILFLTVLGKAQLRLIVYIPGSDLEKRLALGSVLMIQNITALDVQPCQMSRVGAIVIVYPFPVVFTLPTEGLVLEGGFHHPLVDLVLARSS